MIYSRRAVVKKVKVEVELDVNDWKMLEELRTYYRLERGEVVSALIHNDHADIADRHKASRLRI